MKFVNVKLSELTIESDDSELDKIINENKKKLPQFNHEILSFTAKNIPYCLINAYRRCAIDELKVKHLYFILNSLKTNDPYILQDLLKDRIEMIPLLQSVDISTTFKLNVSNLTDKVIPVYSSELVSSDKKLYFNQTFKVCDLNPNCYIKIDNIKIRKSSGEQDGKFSLCVSSYEVENLETSSMLIFSNDFNMYVETFGNISPKDIIVNVKENLIDRLNKIINSINNKTIRKLVIGDIQQYFIQEEGYTIGELLRTYIYNYYKNNLRLINYDPGYPTERGIVLNIIHPEYEKAIIDSIDIIKKDIELFSTNLLKEL